MDQPDKLCVHTVLSNISKVWFLNINLAPTEKQFALFVRLFLRRINVWTGRPAHTILHNVLFLFLPLRIFSGWFLPTEPGGGMGFLSKWESCKCRLFTEQRSILLQFPGSEWLRQHLIKKQQINPDRINWTLIDLSLVTLYTMKATEKEKEISKLKERITGTAHNTKHNAIYTELDSQYSDARVKTTLTPNQDTTSTRGIETDTKTKSSWESRPRTEKRQIYY